MDKSSGVAPESDEPARAAPDRGATLAAVNRSAGRRQILFRLGFVLALVVGTMVFGLGTATSTNASSERHLLGALVWGLLMGAGMWLFVRSFDRRMKAYKTFEGLVVGRVSHVQHEIVTIQVDEAPERSWRFGRRGEELAPGQGVWLAEVKGAPVALAYRSEPHRPVMVLWSRTNQPLPES